MMKIQTHAFKEYLSHFFFLKRVGTLCRLNFEKIRKTLALAHFFFFLYVSFRILSFLSWYIIRERGQDKNLNAPLIGRHFSRFLLNYHGCQENLYNTENNEFPTHTLSKHVRSQNYVDLYGRLGVNIK